ncbi:MAG TPA: M28 family peptidase, partial [Gemmatimonadaceae bacterium]|nr:M28 family peptidase [Gemmatimonadaceae bacterium]
MHLTDIELERREVHVSRVAPAPLGPPVRPRPRVGIGEPRPSTLKGRLLVLAAIGVGALSVAHQLTPPDVVPASAPPTAFSADRAFLDVQVLAIAPRPVASLDHAAARSYLIERLHDLGLTPSVQSTTSALRFPGAAGFNAGSVRNVIARLPGYASTGAIALNAHYDGGRTGPAAADCGACVAAVLETVRALQWGPRLRNDLIVVFSDAEEAGNLGANAFATQHPWMRDVRVALNFEAMGTGGPVSLYATSQGNRALVERFASVAPDALVSPLLVGVVRGGAEPRAAGDLQDYLDAGSGGLGFLFSGNSPANHTVLDNPATFDRRTLQQSGGYALSLVRALGSEDLAALRADTGDAVFFNLWRGLVVTYPTSSALPIAAVAVLLFVGVMSAGLRRQRLSVAHAALGGVVFLETVAATAVVVGAVWWGVRALSPDLQVVQVGHYGDRWSIAGLVTLAVGCAAMLSSSLGRQIAPHARFAGALAGFAALAVVTASSIPETSYAFAGPLLAGSAFLAWLFSARHNEASPWWTAAAAGVVALVATVLLLPLGLDLFMGFMRR